MKMTRFSETRVLRILNEHEAGRDTKDLCRENGISRATYYNWKKYGGMDASKLKRLNQEGYYDYLILRELSNSSLFDKW